MTMVVYSDYSNRVGTLSVDLFSVILIWSSLCLPELAMGLKLLLTHEDSTPEIEDEDVIPILVAQDVIKTPDEALIICPHCEYVFPDAEEESGSTTCPNCTHQVIPMH